MSHTTDYKKYPYVKPGTQDQIHDFIESTFLQIINRCKRETSGSFDLSLHACEKGTVWVGVPPHVRKPLSAVVSVDRSWEDWGPVLLAEEFIELLNCSANTTPSEVRKCHKAADNLAREFRGNIALEGYLFFLGDHHSRVLGVPDVDQTPGPMTTLKLIYLVKAGAPCHPLDDDPHKDDCECCDGEDTPKDFAIWESEKVMKDDKWRDEHYTLTLCEGCAASLLADGL